MPFACEKISAVILGRPIIQFVQQDAETVGAYRDVVRSQDRVTGLVKSSSRLSVWNWQWQGSSSLTTVTSL